MLKLPLHFIEHPARQESEQKKILVMLHGYGSHEEDLFGMYTQLDPRFHIISLRAPIRLEWGGFAWFDIEFLSTGITINEEQAFHQLEHLKATLRQIKDHFNGADLVLLGFSQGTIMSFGTAVTEPSLVSALVGFSGRIVDTMVPKHPPIPLYREIPIIQTHGTMDPVIPIAQGRHASEVLKKLEFDHTFKEYSFQHEISMNCLNDVNRWIKGNVFKD
ncbi:MAG: dienelactone hydrolase family protein [Bacteroidetes bacterium]|nr:dienelactone hydrolase family protein [Bacteroidota bacterium]